MDTPGVAYAELGITHGLLINPGQLRRGTRTAGQVERFQDLHNIPVRLRHGPSGSVVGTVGKPEPTRAGGPRSSSTIVGRFLEISCPQAGALISAGPDRSVRLHGSSRVRYHAEHRPALGQSSGGRSCVPVGGLAQAS